MYYSKDVEGFGTGLKRIAQLCKETNCKYSFDAQKNGFVVTFYRNNLGGTPQDTPQDVSRITKIEALKSYCIIPRTREEIQKYLGIHDRKHFREYYIKPLLKNKELKMTLPNKPNSKFQKYVYVVNNK